MKDLNQLLLISCMSISTINASISDDQDMLQTPPNASPNSAFTAVVKKSIDSDNHSSEHSSKRSTPVGTVAVITRISDNDVTYSTPLASPVAKESEEEIQETEEEVQLRQALAQEAIELERKEASSRIAQRVWRGHQGRVKYNDTKVAKNKKILKAAEEKTQHRQALAEQLYLQNLGKDSAQDEEKEQKAKLKLQEVTKLKEDKNDSRYSSNSDDDETEVITRSYYAQDSTNEKSGKGILTGTAIFAVASAATCFIHPIAGVVSVIAAPSLVTLGHQAKDWFEKYQNSNEPFETQMKSFLEEQGSQWHQWYAENQKYGLSFFDYDHIQKALMLEKDQWALWIQQQQKEWITVKAENQSSEDNSTK